MKSNEIIGKHVEVMDDEKKPITQGILINIDAGAAYYVVEDGKPDNLIRVKNPENIRLLED